MIHAVESVPPNWLPVPGDLLGVEKRKAVVDEADFFSKGALESYMPEQGEGMIKSAKGDSIPFSFAEIDVIGDRKDLEAGMTVGFDASMTSHGLRATRLKIY